jgi:hypothetical protein
MWPYFNTPLEDYIKQVWLYFIYIVAVSFIGGGNRSFQRKTTEL